jgi:hypothetical protein
MPTVPRLEPQVATAPLPGVRLSPDAPTGAFQPASGPDLSGAAEFFARERAKGDQRAVLEADNQLSELAIKLQGEALKRRGKDALGATEATTAAWQQQAAEIEQHTITGEAQTLAFRQRAVARWASLHEAVERHAAAETHAYDDGEANKGLVNRLNDAVAHYTDPAKVRIAIAEQQAIVKDWGARNGLGAEELKDKLASVTSKTQTAVLERMLTNG